MRTKLFILFSHSRSLKSSVVLDRKKDNRPQNVFTILISQAKKQKKLFTEKPLLKNLNGFSCDQILWCVLNDLYWMIRLIGDDVLRNSYTVKPVYKDTERAIESVRIKRVEFRENIRAFFPPGTKANCP